MAEPVRRTAEIDHSPALEDAVKDRLGEIRIVKHLAPSLNRFIRGEDHRPTLEIALVDDLEQHVRRVGRMDEVANFIDHENRVMAEGMERLRQTPVYAGKG